MIHIDSGRILIRELQLSDARALAQHANDRQVWSQLRDVMPYPYREEHATAFIEHVRSQEYPNAFAIVLEDQAIGTVGLTAQGDINRLSAELGYWLGVVGQRYRHRSRVRHHALGDRQLGFGAGVCNAVRQQPRFLPCFGESRVRKRRSIAQERDQGRKNSRSNHVCLYR